MPIALWSVVVNHPINVRGSPACSPGRKATIASMSTRSPAGTPPGVGSGARVVTGRPRGGTSCPCLLHPTSELGRGHDAHGEAHRVVVEAAELGAHPRVGPRPGEVADVDLERLRLPREDIAL